MDLRTRAPAPSACSFARKASLTFRGFISEVFFVKDGSPEGTAARPGNAVVLEGGATVAAIVFEDCEKAALEILSLNVFSDTRTVGLLARKVATMIATTLLKKRRVYIHEYDAALYTVSEGRRKRWKGPKGFKEFFSMLTEYLMKVSTGFIEVSWRRQLTWDCIPAVVSDQWLRDHSAACGRTPSPCHLFQSVERNNLWMTVTT